MRPGPVWSTVETFLAGAVAPEGWTDDGRVGMIRTLKRNIIWGIAWGLGVATLFSLYVVVLALIRGTWLFPPFGVSGVRILTTYYVTGAIGGIVIGLLRPWLRYWQGSFAVGLLAGLLIYGGISYALQGRPDLLMAALLGLLVGGPGGILFWHREWRRRKKA